MDRTAQAFRKRTKAEPHKFHPFASTMPDDCAICNGKKADAQHQVKTCPTCKGKGVVTK